MEYSDAKEAFHSVRWCYEREKKTKHCESENTKDSEDVFNVKEIFAPLSQTLSQVQQIS